MFGGVALFCIVTLIPGLSLATWTTIRKGRA
jgi:hypothetical protein